MTVYIFGNYPDKFYLHLHAIFTDGLFNEKKTCYVMPKAKLKPLKYIFRAVVFKMLRE